MELVNLQKEEAIEKIENNIKQVKLALYYLFNFRARQGSGSKRLYAARKKYNNRSVSFKNLYRNFHKENK